MDDDVKRSGIFEIAMTNTSWKSVKIRRNTNMGQLKSCVQDDIFTIHQILTFDKLKDESKHKVVEKNMYAIPIRTKSGQIEINTLIPTQEQPRIGIYEIGPQENFVKYEKPKLTDAPVNAKVLEDLEKLLEENKNAFALDETQIEITPLIQMSIDTGDHPPIAKRPYTLALKQYE